MLEANNITKNEEAENTFSGCSATLGNDAPSRCEKFKKGTRKVDTMPNKDPNEKMYANLSSDGSRANRKTPKTNPEMLEAPVAAALFAVTSIMSVSIRAPYIAKVKKVLTKDEKIMYAEYSPEISRLLVVKGINSHIILSSAWKLVSLSFTLLRMKEGRLYKNKPIKMDVIDETNTTNEIPSIPNPIETR